MLSNFCHVQLGDRIKQLRAVKGWTQQQLARAAGVSQQTIGKIEKNKSREPQKLPRIASALGETVESILSRVDQVRQEPVGKVTKLGSKKPRSGRPRWPFRFPYQRYDNLPEDEKAEIEGTVWGRILKYEARRPTRSKSNSS